MSITQLVCAFVILVIQQTMRMHLTLSFEAYPAVQHFSTLFHKRHDFRKNKLLNTKCVFRVSLQLLSEIFFILRRIKRDMIENIYWSSCKVLFILVRF